MAESAGGSTLAEGSKKPPLPSQDTVYRASGRLPVRVAAAGMAIHMRWFIHRFGGASRCK
jgi:hypothetical protein